MAKDLHIVPYRPDLAQAWDAFVDASSNGTLFHKQAFLAYHGLALAHAFRHLLFYKGEELVAVLPAGVVRDTGAVETTGDTLRSPYGSSFGGFVTAGNGYARDAALVEALVRYARENSLRQIKLTSAPACYPTVPEAGLEFALLKSGFTLANRDICQVVDVRSEALKGRDPLETYSYACNKQVRKAMREGVSVRMDPDLAAFHAILTANRAKHNVVPTHSLEDLRKLSALVPGAFHLFGAYRGEKLIAGMLCFAANARVLLNFYSCHLDGEAQTGVANLLIHHGIDWARQRGFHYYDFGTSSIRMQPNEGLIRFKESFGGGSVLRDTYEWEAS
jgi:hypothetical protein